MTVKQLHQIPPIRLEVVEAAAWLRISRALLYQRIKAGKISVVKDGHRTFIAVAELQRYASAPARAEAA